VHLLELVVRHVPHSLGLLPLRACEIARQRLAEQLRAMHVVHRVRSIARLRERDEREAAMLARLVVERHRHVAQLAKGK
jgi:hypothetical protein